MKAISKTRFIEAVRTWDAKQVAGTLHERPEFVSILDDAGRTLLHNCARRPISNENNSAASIATANVLLKAGVPIDAVEAIKDDGEIFPATALWYALAWGRNRPLASFLLKAGADPSHCMFALVYADDLASAKLVRRYGAEVDEVFGGETPLIYAMRHQRAKFSECSLVSNAGDVVWKKTDYITNLSKLTEAYTYDQLAQTPQLTIKSFEQVSVLLSRQIFSDLKQ
jgi:hypothetical protein